MGSEMVTDDTSARSLVSALPFAIPGALALLALVSDIVAFQEDIGAWVSTFTYPTAEFLFGRFAALFEYELIGWQKNYLIVGSVFAGHAIRPVYNQTYNVVSNAMMAVLSVIVWPLVFIVTIVGHEQTAKSGGSVFILTFGIYAIIILINFALLNAGYPAVQQ